MPADSLCRRLSILVSGEEGYGMVDHQSVEWQDQFGFVQTNVISGGQRVLTCAGQVEATAVA
jgi:adenosyl cobinamide kinase/adenosyl cobinamide phosphate guanylyltransferase